MCSAKFYCYTELQRHDQRASFALTSRGCIDQKTPIMCEPFGSAILHNGRINSRRRLMLFCCTDSWCNSQELPYMSPNRAPNAVNPHKITKATSQQQRHQPADKSPIRPVTRHTIIHSYNPVYIVVPVAAACVVLSLVIFVVYLVKRREAATASALHSAAVAMAAAELDTHGDYYRWKNLATTRPSNHNNLLPYFHLTPPPPPTLPPPPLPPSPTLVKNSSETYGRRA